MAKINHDLRRTHLCGSDIGIILGCAMYKGRTPLDIYYEKMGMKRADDVDLSKTAGHRYEPLVLEAYREQVGDPEYICDTFVEDKEIPHFGGHPDAFIPRKKLFDAKGIFTPQGAAKWNDKVLHPAITLQLRWYMAKGMLDIEDAYALVYRLPDFWNIQVFHVKRDDRLERGMRNLANQWWHDHIVAQVPPPPTNATDVVKYVRAEEGKTLNADEDIVKRLARIKELRSFNKELKEQENEVKMLLKDSERVMCGEKQLATFYNLSRTTLNLPPKVKDYLTNKYGVKTHSRILRIK